MPLHSKNGILALSALCLLGSTFGIIAHFFLVQNWEWLEEVLPKRKHLQQVALTLLYLQVPQHVLEVLCLVCLFYGLIKSKRQFMLPWLIVNAIGLGLYSTILLVVGMVLSGYLFLGYFLIVFYGILWYYVQMYYSNLPQTGDSGIGYAIME